jgi:hypothetical protein
VSGDQALVHYKLAMVEVSGEEADYDIEDENTRHHLVVARSQRIVVVVTLDPDIHGDDGEIQHDKGKNYSVPHNAEVRRRSTDQTVARNLQLRRFLGLTVFDFEGAVNKSGRPPGKIRQLQPLVNLRRSLFVLIVQKTLRNFFR